MANAFVEDLICCDTLYHIYFGDTYLKVRRNIKQFYKSYTFGEKPYDYKILNSKYNDLDIDE